MFAKHFRHLVEELRKQESEAMLRFIRESRQALLAARNNFQNARNQQIYLDDDENHTHRGQSPQQQQRSRPSTSASDIIPDFNGSTGSVRWRPDSAGSSNFLEPRARSAVRTPSDIQMIDTPPNVCEKNLTRPASCKSAKAECRPEFYREATEEVILNMRIASAKMENDRARQSELTQSMIDKRKDQKNRRLEELFGQAQDAERKQQEQQERQRQQTINAIEEKKRQR